MIELNRAVYMRNAVVCFMLAWAIGRPLLVVSMIINPHGSETNKFPWSQVGFSAPSYFPFKPQDGLGQYKAQN